MATLNTNTNFVSLTPNSGAGSEVEIQAYYSEISIEFSRDMEDTSVGSGTDYVTNAPKLGSFSGSFVVAIDDTNYDTYSGVLDTDAETPTQLNWIIGGKTAGNPEFIGNIWVENVSTEQSVEKNKIMVSVDFVGTGAPTSTFAGALAGTYTAV